MNIDEDFLMHLMNINFEAYCDNFEGAVLSILDACLLSHITHKNLLKNKGVRDE